MRTYLIKRLLLMFPTIFGISLVVFVIITNAPGSPAAMKAPGGEGSGQISANQVASKETYQIFKKHFHLDKGIVFNNYPWLSKEKVRRRMDEWMGGTPKESIAASDALLDYGPYAIPHAVKLLEEARELSRGSPAEKAEEILRFRRFIVYLISQNSVHDIEKVEKEEGERFTVADLDQLEINKELQIENALFREIVLPEKATMEEAARIEQSWIGWYNGFLGILGPQKAVPADEIGSACAEAAAAGTHRALQKGGSAFGARTGPSGAASLAGWVAARTDAELPGASEFASFALSAMMPLPANASAAEEKIRSKWIGTLTATEGGSAVRFARIRERWTAVVEGRQARFAQSPLGKVSTALFDTRFAHYWRNLVVLDFGYSMQYKGKKVAGLIWRRLNVSVTFALLSFLIAYTISIPIGIFSAVRKDSLPDRVVTVILFIEYSMPSFFLAVLLQRLFTIGKPFAWFPTSGFSSPDAIGYPALAYVKDVVWHLVLPLICLTSGSFAALSRYMRAGLLEVIRSDYIRTARAKGLSEFIVIFKHALRNGLIPILTMVGNILPGLIGGSVIIEVIFNVPGMGQLMVEAIFARDYNLVMADSLIAGFLVLCGMLLSDILYVLVDPRISFD